MPTIRAYTRTRPGRNLQSGADCFLSGGHTPDSFQMENPTLSVQTHTSVMSVRQTVCFAVFSASGPGGQALAAVQMAVALLREEIPRMLLLTIADVDALIGRYRLRLARQLRELNQADPAKTGVSISLAAIRSNEAIMQADPGCCAFVSRSGIARSFGRSSEVVKLSDGDRLLLGSSGLCPGTDELTISNSFRIDSIDQAADQLVAAAAEQSPGLSQTCLIIQWTAHDRERSSTLRMDKQPDMKQPQKEDLPPPPEKPPYDPWAHFPVWVAYFGLALAIVVGLVIYFGLRGR